MAALTSEQARVLYLNAKGDALLDEKCWLGTATKVELWVNQIIRHAIALGSPALLIAHNHPSGDPSPSRQDADFTRHLLRICKALEIRMLDHIIISSKGSFSFRQRGYM